MFLIEMKLIQGVLIFVRGGAHSLVGTYVHKFMLNSYELKVMFGLVFVICNENDATKCNEMWHCTC